MSDHPVPRPAAPEPARPDPEDLVTDADRQVVVQHVQRAVVDDIVPFEQLDARLARIHAASTRAELDAAIADLPTPPPPDRPATVGHLAPKESVTLIGDTTIGGWIDVEGDLTAVTVLGDKVIDLSSATLPPEVTISAWTLIGDTTVIVPDGVRTAVSAISVIGDRKTVLAPAQAGAPTVRIESRTLIGDVKVYSLSELPTGKLRKLWRRLRTSEAEHRG